METRREGASQEQLHAMALDIKQALKPADVAQLIRLIEPTPSTGEMSAEEFENLMAELNAKSTRRGYSETSTAAARLVLVMGASIAEAAAETEVSRVTVHQLLRRIRRRMEDLPKGWVPVSAWLPVEIAKQLESIEAMLKDAQASGELQSGDMPTLTLR